MNSNSQFVHDWLTAHIKFLDLTEVDVVEHAEINPSFSVKPPASTTKFYAVGGRSCQHLYMVSPYPITYACVLRGLMEVAKSTKVKHNVDDAKILEAVGQKTPMEELMSRT